MFFIVYFIGAGKHVIIPIHWVNNYKAEKSMKYAINSNQKHLCYYTPIDDIEVQKNRQPNFQLQVERTTENGECCFHGMIVNFHSKYSIVKSKSSFIRQK